MAIGVVRFGTNRFKPHSNHAIEGIPFGVANPSSVNLQEFSVWRVSPGLKWKTWPATLTD